VAAHDSPGPAGELEEPPSAPHPPPEGAEPCGCDVAEPPLSHAQGHVVRPALVTPQAQAPDAGALVGHLRGVLQSSVGGHGCTKVHVVLAAALGVHINTRLAAQGDFITSVEVNFTPACSSAPWSHPACRPPTAASQTGIMHCLELDVSNFCTAWLESCWEGQAIPPLDVWACNARCIKQLHFSSFQRCSYTRTPRCPPGNYIPEGWCAKQQWHAPAT